ncbi:MAG TPA: NPCBM/NEW2 domain-containing protein, partial [Pirellulaceae bacterium]|nr:NPCBM/NEW2 domain-containing protein [Pirellulaceae bacterium]
VPRRAVAAIVCDWPSGLLAQDRFLRKLCAQQCVDDQLWLVDGDVLEGSLVEAPTERYGQAKPGANAAAGDEPPARIGWKLASDTLDVSLNRVRAIVLKSPRASAPANRDEQPGASDASRAESLMMLGFRDGTRLLASRFAASVESNKPVELTFSARSDGSRWRAKVDSALFWDQLVFIQPLNTPLRYLSDVTPLGYKHIPLLSAATEYGVDASVSGGLLRQSDRLSLKGLSQPGGSRLAFDLDGEWKTLAAEIAVDQAAGRRGSVIFRVFTDSGDGQWRGAYESPLVRGGEPARSIQVDLAGAKRLALIVDFADRGDEFDWADWLDARLISR